MTRVAQSHDHNHQHHHGAALADAAQGALEAAGEQWTEMRAGVFEVLSGFDRPASAYDIADAVGKARGRRVAANSVYRILDLFVATNLAQRVESANAYVANSHPGCRHDCIFMVCDACGQVTHVDDETLSVALRGVAARSGFSAVRPVIEVRGRCGSCAAN